MYLRALLAGMAVIWLTACSEPDPGPTTYALPDAADQPDTGAGFQFADIVDDAGDRVPDDLDSGGDDLEPTDSATEADETAADADDVDTGPAAITSCVGHCGILLVDIGNPCSCHPSCKAEGNCCADFIVACTCDSGGDAACDDADDCTLDSCKAGYCLQLPVPSKSCCHADAECKGGDKCTVPKCIQGTCSPQTTNCDDGLACTNDVCDPATGACVNKQLTGQCVIDGACHKAGDTDPDSTGCSICDPSKSTSAWSAKAGTCSIDGMCWKTGDTGPAGTCAVCDAAKSTSAWTIKPSNCLIDGKCIAATTPNPANASCEVCDPASSTSAWSGMPGKCAVDGTCYDKDAPDPAAPDCSICDPAKNKAGFSLKTGFCLIEGTCIKAAAMQAGSYGCATCNVEKSTTAWTSKAAATACDDGTMCTSSDKCDGKGACKGTALANCCIADEDCANALYTDGAPGPCEKSACKKALGTCEKQVIVSCCEKGVCCDVGAKTFTEKNTPCSTFVKGVEYQCSGNDAQKREIFNGCTGTDASKCSSDAPGYGPWKTVKTCSTGTVCKMGDPTQIPGCPLQ